MQLDHLAEMKAVNGECDRQGKESRAAEQDPEQDRECYPISVLAG